MISKKFSIFLLVATVVLFFGVASAATTQTPSNHVNYTDAQKACIKTAQNKMMTAVKPLSDALSSATSGALEAKQTALEKAQALTNEKAKTAAIKSALDAYNNDPAVKEARVPFMAKINEIEKQFQTDEKSCLSENNVVGFFQNIFKSMEASLSSPLISNTSTKKPVVPAVQYTDAQKTCIKAAQDKRMNIVRPASDAFQSQTKVALKARQDAITAAQKLKDTKARSAAIKTASDAYNNNDAVKQAKPAYMTAIKSANDQFQIDQKVCLAGSSVSLNKNLFKSIATGVSNFGAGMMRFFTGKK